MATTQVPALVIEMIDVEELAAERAHAHIACVPRSEFLDPYENDDRQVMISWWRPKGIASAWFTRAALAPILFPEEG
jgi:hypothetical protein